MIQTERLKLVPSTVPLARAEIGDRDEFARLLTASVPANWPPATLADALPLFLSWLEAAPDQVGWFGWYALLDVPTRPVLIGSGGFLGPPENGSAQIGYSVLAQFQRQGHATELVNGLVQWGFAHPEVVRIVAETEWANPASVRVLQKVGFAQTADVIDNGGARFELLRP